MMKHPRLLSLLIALVLCLFVGAAGAEANTVVTNMYEFDVQELGFADQDEFFSYYVEQKLYGYEWAACQKRSP